MSNDMLSIIFGRQRLLQQKIGEDIDSQEYKNRMAFRLQLEAAEAIRETPYKESHAWGNANEYNEEAFREEVVDCLAYVINLALSGGMSAEEMFNRYVAKNVINFERLKNKNGNLKLKDLEKELDEFKQI